MVILWRGNVVYLGIVSIFLDDLLTEVPWTYEIAPKKQRMNHDDPIPSYALSCYSLTCCFWKKPEVKVRIHYSGQPQIQTHH